MSGWAYLLMIVRLWFMTVAYCIDHLREWGFPWGDCPLPPGSYGP